MKQAIQITMLLLFVSVGLQWHVQGQIIQQTIISYDAYGNSTEVRNAQGGTTRYFYGSNGAPYTQSGMDGVEGVYLTGVVQVIGAEDSPVCSGDDLCMSASYDDFGRVSEITSPSGVEASYAYDAFHRLKEVRNDAGLLTSSHTYTYTGGSFSASNPNWVETSVYDGSTTRKARQYIDGLGRQVQSVTLGEGQVVVGSQEYDAQGRPWKRWKPYYRSGTGLSYEDGYAAAGISAHPGSTPFSEQRYEASPLGRPDSSIALGGSANGVGTQTYGVATIGSDKYAYTETTDPEGKVRRTYTDGWGRTVRTVADPGGANAMTHFIYNTLDQLVEVRPPNYYAPPSGSSASDWVITYAYDTRGNMIRKKSNDFGVVGYIYNKANLLRFSQDANQAAADQVGYVRYDELGRVTESGVGEYAGAFNAAALNPETTQSFENDDEDSDGNLKSVMAYDGKPSTGVYPWSRFASQISGFTVANAEGQLVGSMYRYGGEGIPESSALYGSWFTGGSQTLQASDTLSAANTTVGSGAGVTFEAGKAIILKDGFNAESGSDFTAKITPALIGTSGEGVSSLTGANPWMLELHSYDSEGRLATKKIYVGEQRDWDATLTYTYNRAGELTRMGTTIAGETLYQHYGYNALGQLVTVTLTSDGTADTEPVAASYSYTSSGAVANIRYQGGAAMDYGYDIRDWVSSINSGASSGSYFAASYTYKDNGNIASSSFYNPRLGGGLSAGHKSYNYEYDYDGRNQLTRADYFYGTSFNTPGTHFDVDALTYDPNGNLTSLQRRKENGALIDNLTYNYSTSNRLSSLADAVSTTAETWDAEDASYTYDANGNMTSQSGKVTSIAYNEMNLPVHTTLSGGAEILAGYNGGGYRILKELKGQSWEYHLRDATRTLAVVRNDTLQYFTLYGGDMIGQIETPGGTLSLGSGHRYFLKDHLGSIRQVVDAGGASQSTTDYYPFGLVMPGRSSNSANPNDTYKFTGYELDDEAGLGIYHANARGYDPTIARFIQIDPLADQFPEISPYAYGNNNPLWYTDPTGMAPEEAGDCPPCDFEYLTRSLFQNYDNTYVGDLFRADAQGEGKLEQKVAQDAEAAGNAVVDATAELADDVSDASTIVAAGGIVAAPFTGGSSLTATAYALGVGTAADATSLAAKSVDAVAFDGSGGVAFEQFVETSINIGAGKIANRVAGSFVRVGSTGRFYSPSNGRFVTNQFGFNVSTVRDATRVAVPLVVPTVINKVKDN